MPSSFSRSSIKTTMSAGSIKTARSRIWANADTAAVTAPSYNWGYNPLNYNVVEGAYSSNPYPPDDPHQRVQKPRFNPMRTMVASASIMDVVYNHVSSANNSAFQKLVPYYYFRTSSDGAFTNGSGVGQRNRDPAADGLEFHR
jgi:pullulanase